MFKKQCLSVCTEKNTAEVPSQFRSIAGQERLEVVHQLAIFEVVIGVELSPIVKVPFANALHPLPPSPLVALKPSSGFFVCFVQKYMCSLLKRGTILVSIISTKNNHESNMRCCSVLQQAEHFIWLTTPHDLQLGHKLVK